MLGENLVRSCPAVGQGKLINDGGREGGREAVRPGVGRSVKKKIVAKKEEPAELCRYVRSWLDFVLAQERRSELESNGVNEVVFFSLESTVDLYLHYIQ